jgi:hypothetical protein
MRLWQALVVWSTGLAAACTGGGCTCGSKSAGPSTSVSDSAPPSAPRPSSAGPAPPDLSVFSAPIAAARVGHADVVAGFVATAHVVRVMAIVGGSVTWSVDALQGVRWAPDAELRLGPADGGVSLVWREPHADRVVRQLVLLGPQGEPRGAPVEIGASFCSTADGVAWIDPRPTGAARVLARRWSDRESREAVAVSADRDPALVCGSHAVYVLGDGDDDLTATSFVPGEAAEAPQIILRDADFGEDEEREHDTYAIGDDLGLVWMGASGAVAVREIPRGQRPGPWRKVKETISPDDDVVAVGSDADAALVVFTHDAEEACAGIGSTSESVRLLRVGRKGGAESVLDLAPPDCAHSLGPFWIAPSPNAATVAWVERATGLAPKAAPIVGAALRTLSPRGITARHIDVAADAVSDGGCDELGCSLVALVRPPSPTPEGGARTEGGVSAGDGMQPESIAVVAYP